MTEEQTYPTNIDQPEPQNAVEQEEFTPAPSLPAKPFGQRCTGADKINILLVSAFIAAIGGLYLFGSRTAPAAASAEQQAADGKIDLALAKVKTPIGGVSGDPDEKLVIERTLNYSVTDRQVPPASLSGNPFAYQLDDASASLSGTNLASNNGAYGESTDLLSAMSAARQLELQSILAGTDGSMALVSNRLLHVGDTIEGWQVAAISPRSVTLKWNGRTYTLRMPEQTGFGGN